MREIGSVKSWDTLTGSGLLARGEHLDDLSFDRVVLEGDNDLEVGQRVSYETDYAQSPGSDDFDWVVRRVHIVSDEDAAVIELETLCDNVEFEDERRSLADEVASEDDVESAQDAWSRANDRMRARVPEIGAALHALGGEPKMFEILSRVRKDLQGTITIQWKGIGSWSGTLP